MSTSPLERRSSILGHTVKAYGLIAASCGGFSAIYLHLSYGQSSPFMVYLFLPPLILGLIPAEVLLLTDRVRLASKAVRLFWNSGVAVMMTGFVVRAVINISGRHTYYDILYWGLSVGFFALAVLSLVRQNGKRLRSTEGDRHERAALYEPAKTGRDGDAGFHAMP